MEMPLFMGKEFNEYWKQVQDNSDLTILEQKQVLQNCQAYIIVIAYIQGFQKVILSYSFVALSTL